MDLFIGITSYRIHESQKLVKLTKDCLQSLVTTDCDRLLLDDSSKLENDFIKIAKENRIKIEKVNYSNLSKSWNHLCKHGFNKFDKQYCLIMNNDIKLCENSLDHLLEYVKKSTNKDNIFVHGSELVNNSLEKGFMFSCFLISKRFYEEVGEFDENIKFSNDWDYIRRIEKLGKSCEYCKDFIILHDRSASKNILHLENDDDRKYLKDKWNCF